MNHLHFGWTAISDTPCISHERNSNPNARNTRVKAAKVAKKKFLLSSGTQAFPKTKSSTKPSPVHVARERVARDTRQIYRDDDKLPASPDGLLVSGFSFLSGRERIICINQQERSPLEAEEISSGADRCVGKPLPSRCAVAVLSAVSIAAETLLPSSRCVDRRDGVARVPERARAPTRLHPIQHVGTTTGETAERQ